MKITIESTSKVVSLDGTPARIWEGTTERGVTVVAFIPRITPLDGDPAEFDADLLEVRPPSPEAAGFPMRLIL